MALPPRSMGPMVDQALPTDEMDPALEMQEVDIATPLDFSGGAEIVENDDGSAIVRALIEAAEMEAMARRIDADLRYQRNWSLKLDIKILIKTFLHIRSPNAY